MLVSNKSLAKVSSTPGKTQLINHFLVNDIFYFVDLPGYGFAKASKTSREKWAKMIWNYFKKRENLLNIFVLIDSRIKLQKIDLELMIKLQENGLPFSIIFTKSDKNGKTVTQKNIASIKRELSEYWDPLPSSLLSSSKEKIGRDELLTFMSEIIVL